MGFSISGLTAGKTKNGVFSKGNSKANSDSDDDVLPNLADSSGSDDGETAATKPKKARISWRQRWRKEIKDMGAGRLPADEVRSAERKACSDDWNMWAQGAANMNEEAVNSDAERVLEKPGLIEPITSGSAGFPIDSAESENSTSTWRRRSRRCKRGGTRGGANRKRGRNPNRDTEHVTMFFANISSYSKHAASYLAGRDEDILLLAETHKDLPKTKAMINELGSLGWQATASAARLSNRSSLGNVGGVLAAVKKYVDNMASSICTDDKGQITPNPFITTRTFTMQSHEAQALSGYLECGGLKGSNLQTLEAVDHITRGGRDRFFWALDANVTP